MASGRVTVRLDAETCRRLEMFAALRAKTLSDLVREALSGYLPSDAQDRSCYDLARDQGLVGAVRNAPRDLSTNRKRLQGFGRR
jgi:hypothetical protein